MAAVQHFSNKTGPNILLKVISLYHRVDWKVFYFRQLSHIYAIARVV